MLFCIDVWRLICCHLSSKDVLSLSAVCRDLQRLQQDVIVWHNLLCRDFPKQKKGQRKQWRKSQRPHTLYKHRRMRLYKKCESTEFISVTVASRKVTTIIIRPQDATETPKETRRRLKEEQRRQEFQTKQAIMKQKYEPQWLRGGFFQLIAWW